MSERFSSSLQKFKLSEDSIRSPGCHLEVTDLFNIVFSKEKKLKNNLEGDGLDVNG